MHKKFNHTELEKKWQHAWEEHRLYEPGERDASKEKRFILVEFPYPSGNLHIGHWFAFAVVDIYARALRMQGHQVFFPIGFDSFGLPAENAAIKRNLDPKAWTYDNIAHMTEQLKSMGNSFSWEATLRTSDPEYYKWTQWMFTKFFDGGIAYRGEAEVNWCPSCNTVLANEQVVQGVCERCGTAVIQKRMEQWMMRITNYADRLIDDLDPLPWPQHIKESQKNWIGRSEGSKLAFSLSSGDAVEVFTTRADTLFGATYLVLAPEHALVAKLQDKIKNWSEVDLYRQATAQKKEIERTAEGKEKTGVVLEGISAINPATGKEIPVYIADYVLARYGTGAIMAVPAHDARDFEFAEKYHIPVTQVIEGEAQLPFAGNEGTLINSGDFTGLTSEEAKKKITEAYEGSLTKTYRLRDWSMGRQRYWGVPIPMVYDPEGKPHPVPEEHLPWLLPTDVDFRPTGEAPLAKSKELKERTERIFGEGWRPEVETMDTFVDSAWYFMRYADNHNNAAFSSIEAQKAWMPVDIYFGGAEHTTMHLLYSRFWQKALFDLGLVTEEEPYKMRVNRGLVLGPDGTKMSKSKGNVIDPDEQVERLGADTVKMYLAFMGPYGETTNYPWDMGGIAGLRRFLERVYGLEGHVKAEEPDEMTVLLHQTIEKTTADIAVFKFNTAISALMIYINAAEKEGLSESSYRIFLRLLAPFAPHMAEELWSAVGKPESIHSASWPISDAKILSQQSVKVAIQINGKTRGMVLVPYDSNEATVLLAAEGDSILKGYLDKMAKNKVIFVKNKIINVLGAILN